MARNCSETVVQLDNQEQPPAETEQRRAIVDAVRKFSSLAKSSASRVGKPFFPVLTKSPRPLRPWPSVTSISHPVQTPSMPIPIVEIEDPWREDSYSWRSSPYRRPSSENSEGRSSVSSQGEKNREGVVNSSFAGERMDDVPDICGCGEQSNIEQGEDGSGPSREPRCKQVSCQQSSAPETIDMSVIGGELRSRVNSSPKYLMIRRDRPTSDSKKKGIQWRSRLSGRALKFRRRTTDSIPKVSEVLSQTWSSPNLRNLEEQARAAQSAKVNPCKQEEDSKL